MKNPRAYIRSLLLELNYPCYATFGKGNKSDDYIIYRVTNQQGDLFADNSEIITEFAIDILSVSKSDPSVISEKVEKIMKDNFIFKVGEIDGYEDGDYYITQRYIFHRFNDKEGE